MKTMSILGIILSSIMLLVCLTVLTEEGVLFIAATYLFFLASSIVSLKSLEYE